MSNTRRYTEDQKRRVIESGEKPVQMDEPYGFTDFLSTGPVGLIADQLGATPQVRRFQANVRAGIPRAATDILSLVGIAPAAVRAGLDSEVDLADAMYGDEGLKEIGEFVRQKRDDAVARMPEAMRTTENLEKLDQALMSHKSTRDFMRERAPAAYRAGIEGGNAINSVFGLGEVEQETTVDEIGQIIGSAMVPLPTGLAARATAGLAEGAVRTAARGALNVAELALPGTTGATAGRVAANAGIGAGLTQGVRGLTDQPSVFTGDALGADQGVDLDYAAIDEDDQDTNLNGEQLAASSAGIGGILLGLGVALGKRSGILKHALDDEVNVPVDNAVKQSATDGGDGFSPQLTEAQKIKSNAVDGSAPLTDIVKKARTNDTPESRAEAADEVTRAAHEATSTNVSNRFNLAVDTGRLDGLDQPTVPLKVIYDSYRKATPEAQELFEQYRLAGTLIDRRKLTAQTLQDEVTGLRVQQQLAKRDPERYGLLAGQIRQREGKLKGLLDDAEEMRGEVKSMSTTEAYAVRAKGDASPEVKAMAQMYDRINDDLLNARVKLGQITVEDKSRVKANHANYMLLKDDPFAGMSGMLKAYTQAKGRFADTPRGANGIRTPMFMRDYDIDAGRVQTPIKSMDALAQSVMDHIKFTQNNEAIKAFANGVRGTPLDGVAMRSLDRPRRMNDPMIKEVLRKHGSNGKAVSYNDNGMIHFFEVSDPEVARALHFNAPAVNTVLNASRKIWQQGTTGVFAPWFAFKSAAYEAGMGMSVARPGRSRGFIDQSLRRALPNSTALDYALNRITDHSFFLQMVTGVFSQVSARSVRALGEKIGQDLSKQSGLFNAISKVPGGEELLTNIGQAMIKSHNDSTYAAFVNGNMTHHNLMDDAYAPTIASINSVVDSIPGLDSISSARKGAVGAYTAGLESIHNSAKYAFFAQNYSALKKLHKGNIPKKQLDKLIYETKTLSGDMAASAGSPFFTKLYSSLPYSQIMVSSTRYLTKQMMDQPDIMIPRIMTGFVMPMAGIVYAISQNEQARDWYFNKLPNWQRMSSVPMLRAEYFKKFIETGDATINSSDIALTPMAPELAIIITPMMAGMRSMGLFGDAPEATAGFGKEVNAAFEAMVGVGMPPLITASAASMGYKFDPAGAIMGMLGGEGGPVALFQESSHQGVNMEMMHSDSVFNRAFVDTMSALFGNAFGLAAATFDTFADTADNDDETYLSAAKQAFDYGVYEVERRLPELPGMPSIWNNGKRRSYVTTAERTKVQGVLNSWEKFSAQRSIERDSSNRLGMYEEAGLSKPPMVSDPRAQSLVEEIHGSLKQGRMVEINKEITNLNAMLTRLQADKDKMKPDQYHAMQNDFTIRIQRHVAEQAGVINQLEQDLKTNQGIDLQQAMQFIEQSVK